MLIDDLKNKSKGQKLLSLNNKVRLFKIPETICLNCSDVYSSKEHLINTEFLVVRSSASDEDEEAMSSAGEFESVLNLDSSNDFSRDYVISENQGRGSFHLKYKPVRVSVRSEQKNSLYFKSKT
ncbi:hypothetical protein N9401_00625 [Amylibacter sp.]|nr:hypothetical protein [Amylibacter sp.]